MKKYSIDRSDCDGENGCGVGMSEDAGGDYCLASDIDELESRAVDQALRIRELEQSLRWVLDNGVIWHSGDFAAPVYDELKGVKSPDDVYELVSSLMERVTK